VGTCEAGPAEAGHVLSVTMAGSRWIDCGSPDRSNAGHQRSRPSAARLYAGTGRYPPGRLGPYRKSTNANQGSMVVRYDGDDQWAELRPVFARRGTPWGGMVVFRAAPLRLVAVTGPAGFFRYRVARTCSAWPHLRLLALSILRILANAVPGRRIW